MGFYDDLKAEVAQAQASVSEEVNAAAEMTARLPDAQDIFRALLATMFTVLDESGVRASMGYEPEYESSYLRDLIPGPLMYLRDGIGFTAQGDAYRATRWMYPPNPIVARASRESGDREVLILGNRVYVEPDSSGSGERFRLLDDEIVFDAGWGLQVPAERWAKDAVLALSQEAFRKR